jgi:hypothetical protein
MCVKQHTGGLAVVVGAGVVVDIVVVDVLVAVGVGVYVYVYVDVIVVTGLVSNVTVPMVAGDGVMIPYGPPHSIVSEMPADDTHAQAGSANAHWPQLSDIGRPLQADVAVVPMPPLTEAHGVAMPSDA